MTAYYDEDLHAIFLGEEQRVAEPAIRAIVMTLATEVVSTFRLAPYRLDAVYGQERLTVTAHDRRLRLSGSATLDYSFLLPCEDDEIRREIGRTIGRAISRALEREA